MRRPEGVLSLGGVLDADTLVLEASWRRLEASWKRLEPSWRRLGGVVETS